jgi:ABC-type lipoprotein release transport system permease subunit
MRTSIIALFTSAGIYSIGIRTAALGPARRGLAVQPTEALRDE